LVEGRRDHCRAQPVTQCNTLPLLALTIIIDLRLTRIIQRLAAAISTLITMSICKRQAEEHPSTIATAVDWRNRIANMNDDQLRVDCERRNFNHTSAQESQETKGGHGTITRIPGGLINPQHLSKEGMVAVRMRKPIAQVKQLSFCVALGMEALYLISLFAWGSYCPRWVLHRFVASLLQPSHRGANPLAFPYKLRLKWIKPGYAELSSSTWEQRA